MRSRQAFLILPTLVLASVPTLAFADTPAASPSGAPADAKPLVEAPKDPAGGPSIDKPDEGTTATLSAGALWTEGNSKLLAGTVNGIFENRTGQNGYGASLLGNYGQGASAGNSVVATTENVQGRLRYDRYLSDRLSVFGMVTGRHDRFQGLDFRLNLDPGVKYIFVNQGPSAFWGEAGYDFQYDIRRDEDRFLNPVTTAASTGPNGPTISTTTYGTVLDKTATDHSLRLFAGAKHAFNESVTARIGLEYLQSVVDSTRYRLNGDALLAAKVGGGFSVGFGLSVRYDHSPLQGKEMTDTSTNLTLIYSFTTLAPAAPTCPCPEPAPATTPPTSDGTTPATPAPSSQPAPTAPSK